MSCLKSSVPRRLGVSLIALLVVSAPAAAGPQQGLTAAPQIARVYSAIFDAKFDDIPAMAAATCPPAPREVCQLLSLVSLWWRIQLDPDNTQYDATFEARADAAVAAVDAWTKREPERAEAWFYLGGAYGARAQWRVLRGQRLAAARDGKRIKDALEDALRLDPSMQDAWFGIGLYHYYADVAPTAAKILRFLLLLPGGDRVEGLKEMLRARNGGQLLRDEADYQLQVVYLWYEKDPARALELLRGLRERHPRNPHFQQSIADVQDTYQHDITASLRSWQALLDAAEAGRTEAPLMAATRARLGIARQLDRLSETDRAVDALRAVVSAHPAAPFEAVAQAQLQLGQALDRLGDRRGAETAYRAAIQAAPPADPLKVLDQARTGLRSAPDPAAARAYRLSIEGWRALERGALADAARAIAQSLALRPGDQVTRYRQAKLLEAQHDDGAALGVYDAIVRARRHAAGLLRERMRRRRAPLRGAASAGARDRTVLARARHLRRRRAHDRGSRARARAPRPCSSPPLTPKASVRVQGFRDVAAHLTPRVRLDVGTPARVLTTSAILCLTAKESHP